MIEEEKKPVIEVLAPKTFIKDQMTGRADLLWPIVEITAS